jgi:hypothetical protein
VSDGSRAGQKLWFNDGGVRKAFKALRLSDDRRQRGVAVEGALTQQEKQVSGEQEGWAVSEESLMSQFLLSRIVLVFLPIGAQ